MAHESPNIPWGVLAEKLHYTHFRYRNPTPEYCVANLFAKKYDDNYNEHRNFFVKGFLDMLEEHSFATKAKYSEVKEPPREDKMVISRATVHKITHARQHEISINGRFRSSHQTPLNDTSIQSLLEAFSTPFDVPDIMPPRGANLLKELLLYGDIDSILQLLSHPRLGAMIKPASASELIKAIKHLVQPALEIYICLNLILQKRKLYDPDEEAACPFHTTPDYRHTRAYQKTLLHCTEAVNPCIPHRLFFGAAHYECYQVTQLPLSKHRPKQTKMLYNAHRMPGRIPFEEFKSLLYAKFTPTQDEFSQAFQILRARSLPAELCFYILDFADYTPSHLKVPEDPLHPANAIELEEHLNYCWQLLIRVNALAQFAEWELNWEQSIKKILAAFFENL